MWYSSHWFHPRSQISWKYKPDVPLTIITLASLWINLVVNKYYLRISIISLTVYNPSIFCVAFNTAAQRSALHTCNASGCRLQSVIVNTSTKQVEESNAQCASVYMRNKSYTCMKTIKKRLGKVYFRSQILVYKYRSILERETVPVSTDTDTQTMFQYRPILVHKNVSVHWYTNIFTETHKHFSIDRYWYMKKVPVSTDTGTWKRFQYRPILYVKKIPVPILLLY